MEFLKDQRNDRKMFLSSVDKNATRKAEANEKRKEKCSVNPTAPKRKIDSNPSDEYPETKRSRNTVQPLITKHIPLTNLSRECQRYNVSHRAAASISNALLKDLGVSSGNNMIDRNQIQRNITKFNKNVTETHLINIRETIKRSACVGLFFDGKKDKTKTYQLNKRTMRKHPRTVTENHYSIVFQPNNMYYTNITPRGSKAFHVSEGILEKLHADQIDTSKVKFVGGDGTSMNTGHHNGRLFLLQKHYFMSDPNENKCCFSRCVMFTLCSIMGFVFAFFYTKCEHTYHVLNDMSVALNAAVL